MQKAKCKVQNVALLDHRSDVPVAACTGPKKVATGCVPDIESDKTGHYTKLVGFFPVDLKRHLIVCHSGDSCTSNLRMVEQFPIITKRRFLANVHVTDALSAHRVVRDIHHALKNGNQKHLMKITQS